MKNRTLTNQQERDERKITFMGLIFRFFGFLFLLYLSAAGLFLVPENFWTSVDVWFQSVSNQVYVGMFVAAMVFVIGLKWAYGRVKN